MVKLMIAAVLYENIGSRIFFLLTESFFENDENKRE